MMKPLIIKSDKDGNLKMSMDELQNIIDESYNAGYKDGKRDATPTWYQPTYVPTTTPWYRDNTITTPLQDDRFRYYEVTCSSSNNSDDLASCSMAKQRDE